MKEGNLIIYYTLELDDTVVIEVSREHKPAMRSTKKVHKDYLIETVVEMVREVMCVD